MTDGPVGNPLEKRSSATVGLVLALLGLGIALRSFDLGEVSLHGDEILTVRNAESALHPPEELSGDRQWQVNWAAATTPLLQYGTILSFRSFGTTPLAARMLPFLAGIATLFVLPLLVRRLWGSHAAIVSLALLALCPRHVEMCRLARYQSLAYLFGSLAVLATALLIARRTGGWSVLALIAAILAVASHPSALLLSIVVLSVVGTIAWREGRRRVPIGILLLGVVGVTWFLAQGVLPVVHSEFDVGMGGTDSWKLGAVLTYNTGPLVVLVACAAGIEALGRRQPVGGFLALAFLVPTAALLGMATFKAVGVRFFTGAEPALLLLAVLGVQRLAGSSRRRAAVATAVLTLSQVPLLVSNLIDGQRYDYGGLSELVRAHAEPTDLVLCDGHETLDFYLGRSTVELPTAVADTESLVAAHRTGDVYLAVLRQRGVLVYGREAGILEEWLARRAERIETIGRRRLDDRLYRFEIELYRTLPGSSHEQ